MKPIATAASVELGKIYDFPVIESKPPTGRIEEHPVIDSIAIKELELAANIFKKYAGFTIGGFERVAEVRANYAHVPDQYSPGVWGVHDLEFVRLGDIITPTQVRKERNPQFFNIAQSLMPQLDGRNRNLQNLLDMVFIGQELFERYIRFTNKIHGVDDQASNYPSVNGEYQLLAAGYTRTSGMTYDEIMLSELAAQQGHTTNWQDSVVLVKAHKIKTPEDILDIQINENLHSKPSREEEAESMVGTYLWGKEIGKWNSAEAFVAALKDRFPPDLLLDVVAFSNLCPKAREHIVQKKLKYVSGVHLGNAIPAFKEYILFKHYNDTPYDELTPEEQQRFDEHIETWTIEQVTALQNAKPNNAFLFQYFDDFYIGWEAVVGRPLRVYDPKIEEKRKRFSALQADLFADQTTADEKHQVELKKMRKRVTDNMYRIKKRSARDIATLQLHIQQQGFFSEISIDLQERALKLTELIRQRVWDGIIDD